jgi:hypothetical protein
MISGETIPENESGEMKESSEGSEFKYDVFYAL